MIYSSILGCFLLIFNDISWWMNLRVRSTWMMPWGDHLWRNTLAPRPAFKKWVLLQATSTRQRPPRQKKTVTARTIILRSFQWHVACSFFFRYWNIHIYIYKAENAMNFPPKKTPRLFSGKTKPSLSVSSGRSKPSLLKAKVLQLLVP